MPITRRRLLLFSGITYSLWLVVLICTSIVTGYQLVAAAESQDFDLLLRSSSQSKTALSLLNISTATLIPDLRFAKDIAALPVDNYPLVFWLEQLIADPFLPTESPLPAKTTTDLMAQLTTIEKSCSQTWLIRWLAAGQVCPKISNLTQLATTATPFIENHLNQDHTYLILFQNSDELRASGGFMGSFARVVVGAQGLSYLDIQDIYEPDGQFTGYVEPPPGVAEYLSGGNGLRLPDANWAADFPTAAQTILSYFALGNQQSVDGVIAINSHLVEQLLTITGDIYLPDYDTNVSAETFSTLARADRDAFFPGSKQKQHFLSSFMTQLKLRLTELSPAQKKALFSLIRTSFDSKDILAYSSNPALQQLLSANHFTGSIDFPDGSPFLYLLESNVGINKANKKVTRQVSMAVESGETNSLTTTLTITNQNTDLDYANYQRIIVPPQWRLQTLVVNDQPRIDWQSRVSTPTSAAPTPYQEIGFLVGVPSATTTTVTATFSLPSAPTSLTLLKQPGVFPTPYQVSWQGQTQTLLVDQDIQLPRPL